MKPLRSRQQRGLSLLVVLMLGIIIVMLAILAARLVAPITEYMAIQRTVQRIQAEGGTVAEIRRAFDRQADVDGIRSITGRDLDITKEGDTIIISYAYSYDIRLMDRARLVLDFSGSTQTPTGRGR